MKKEPVIARATSKKTLKFIPPQIACFPTEVPLNRAVIFKRYAKNRIGYTAINLAEMKYQIELMKETLESVHLEAESALEHLNQYAEKIKRKSRNKTR